jgi:GT2 family glycosyltransferase
VTPTLSVIIPVYRGQRHLEANLPVLLAAAQRRDGMEVIVVDDGSGDKTPEFLADRFPEVTGVALDANRGFAGACNAGARAARGEILYFLNSDARGEEGFLDRVLEAIADPMVFSVGSREVGSDGDGGVTVPAPFFHFGLFGHRYRRTAGMPSSPIPSFFVSAGHAAFSREKFLLLGGFDDLYRPFYWEDVDLCYRAWRRGWRVLLHPGSRVQHAGQGTIGRFYTPATIQSLYWKNRFLFFWKNVRDPAFIATHLAALPLLLAGLPVVKGRAVLTGFTRALRQLPEALRKRREQRGSARISDRQILDRFSDRRGAR